MPISVRLTEADLAALADERRRFEARTSVALQILARTRVIIWLIFFAGVALVVVGTLALTPGAGPGVQTVVILAATALLSLALFGLVARRFEADTARGVAREEAARAKSLESDYEFEDAGLSVRLPNGTLRFDWRDVRTVVEANDRLFFFPREAASFVLPLRSLSSEQRTALLALVEAKRQYFQDSHPEDLGTR